MTASRKRSKHRFFKSEPDSKDLEDLRYCRRADRLSKTSRPDSLKIDRYRSERKWRYQFSKDEFVDLCRIVGWKWRPQSSHMTFGAFAGNLEGLMWEFQRNLFLELGNDASMIKDLLNERLYSIDQLKAALEPDSVLILRPIISKNSGGRSVSNVLSALEELKEAIAVRKKLVRSDGRPAHGAYRWFSLQVAYHLKNFAGIAPSSTANGIFDKLLALLFNLQRLHPDDQEAVGPSIDHLKREAVREFKRLSAQKTLGYGSGFLPAAPRCTK